MIANSLFWIGLVVSLGIGFVYFRDLGDVTQMIIRVKRANMVRAIRHEYTLIGIGLAGAFVAGLMHLGFGAGPAWAFWAGLALVALFYVFPWVYVHLGLRNQMSSARYYPIKEAKDYVAPANSVLVIENNGVARAHPDHQLLRPHLAGNAEGLDGEDVVMTYCAMANLGVGYKPEIKGQRLKLEVLAQHGNNLILRDNATGEPIQHIYGRFDGAGPNDDGMTPWPTFRMSFRGFEKAYPDGQVYLNKPSANPLLRLFDMAMEIAFSSGIVRQHQEAAPIMSNMTHFDDRLPNKTYVWGIDIGEDAVCYTEDFIKAQGNILNTTVGGRDIVFAHHPEYDSTGAWYNDSGSSVKRIDFFGKSDHGQLQRVERLKPGLFWHVWVQFLPHTEINRVSRVARAA